MPAGGGAPVLRLPRACLVRGRRKVATSELLAGPSESSARFLLAGSGVRYPPEGAVEVPSSHSILRVKTQSSPGRATTALRRRNLLEGVALEASVVCSSPSEVRLAPAAVLALGRFLRVWW